MKNDGDGGPGRRRRGDRAWRIRRARKVEATYSTTPASSENSKSTHRLIVGGQPRPRFECGVMYPALCTDGHDNDKSRKIQTYL